MSSSIDSLSEESDIKRGFAMKVSNGGKMKDASNQRRQALVRRLADIIDGEDGQ